MMRPIALLLIASWLGLLPPGPAMAEPYYGRTTGGAMLW